MNEEIQFNEEQLRLTTTRSLVPGAEIDTETALARERFLALGQSLEAAGANFDEAALVEKLKASCLSAPASVSLVDRRQASSVKLWHFVLGGVLALLVLVSLAWLSLLQPSQSTVAKSPSPAPSGVVTTAQDTDATNLTAESTSPWIDSLDDEIAVAQFQVQWLTPVRRGVDGSMSDVNEQLNAMSQELLGESL
jgi:hypothetical protein